MPAQIIAWLPFPTGMGVASVLPLVVASSPGGALVVVFSLQLPIGKSTRRATSEVNRNTAGTDNMAEDAWLFGVLIQIKMTSTVSAW